MLCVAAQSCLTLCDPVDYSLPGSSAHGIFQVRILECVVVSSSGNLPDIGIELASPVSPALQVGLSLSTEPLRECAAKVHCPSSFCQIQSVQWLSRVRLFATPWTAARQAFLSIARSCSLLKLMSVESVMPSNHFILCRPLLLLSIFPRIRVFSNESVLCIRWSKYWSFNFSISQIIKSLLVCSS